MGQFVSRFLGIRPRFFPCAENPYKSGLNLQPLLQSILRVQGTSLCTAQGRGWPRQSGDEAMDVWGRPTFPAPGSGGVGPRADSPPRPPRLSLSPPRPPPPLGARASPLPPVTPMLIEALSGRRGAGWWLLPLRLQCALWLGAVGGAGEAVGACACDVAASVTSLPPTPRTER